MSTRFPYLERTDGAKRSRPLTIIGLLLVPFMIAGLLVWALWNPADRLGTVKAAIVNNDEPVTLNDQVVPLGRQLGAGLVDSEGENTNYSWIVTDEDGAAEGLEDGTYAAVVTIPENFSKAATSTAGDPEDAEKAVIDVTTSDDSKLIDDAISQVITTTAANVLGTELTSSYLDNVFLGFNTLHDQLGTAAEGASDLADGTSELSDGLGQAAEGADELAQNSDQLVSGAQGLADGASGLADGASEAADGASGLASGASGLAQGLTQLAGGLHQTADGMSELPAQAKQINAGLDEMLNMLDTMDQLQALAEGCDPATEGSCDALITKLKEMAANTDPDANQLPSTDELRTQIQDAKTQVTQLGQLPAAITEMANAADDSAAGASGLASGASGLTSGLQELSNGASQLSTGASQYVEGVTQYTGGVVSLSDAMTQLGDGASKLDDGAASLSDGLAEAVNQIPNYSESERSSLADVVSDPVSTSDDDSAFSFGSGGIPLYAVIALWLGALATFFLLRATPRATLGSTKSAFMLMLRSATPGLLLGVIQGVLVSVIVGIAQGLTFMEGLGFAGVAALIGAAFAAVNQALVAAFGGTGRFISMIVGVLALATGVISTVPGVLEKLFGLFPVSPARSAFSSVLLGTPGIGGAVVALVVWLLAGVAVTTLSIALRRTVSARRLAAAPA